MKKPEIDYDVELLVKYWKGQLTEQEKSALDAWVGGSDNRKRMLETYKDVHLLSRNLNEYEDSDEKLLRNRIGELEPELKQERKGRVIYWRITAAATIIILMTLFGMYYFIRKNEKSTNTVAQNPKTDVAPGTYKATLKLADGRSITLDSATMGQLAQQGSTQVINKDGQLVYAAGKGGSKGEVLWNTLSTLKGQTYPLLLSDGTKVTLNSESSIRFPVVFSGNSREVHITGEVFFEVAHDAGKPFRVKTGEMEVEVLGTTFNVNAYPEEEVVKATLVEGSVRVKKGIKQKIIKPGQQAQVLVNEIKVSEVDPDRIIAWKQGYFRFKEDKLSEAMSNISRWYNVDVIFEGNAANVDVSGDIPRSANLSELVKLLSIIDVEARIEGRKLILKAQ